MEIDGKFGKLECAGVTGELEWEGPQFTFAFRFENRVNEKVPFGLVSASWEFELRNAGQTFFAGTFKLTPTGTSATARSELPDNN